MSSRVNLKANVRRSHSSPSSVYRSGIHEELNEDDYQYSSSDHSLSTFNINNNLRKQQHSNLKTKNLHRRSSFIHHHHSFQHSDFFHYFQYDDSILDLQKILTLIIQWILYLFISFRGYYRLLFAIVTNLFLSSLNFYSLLLAFFCDLIGLRLPFVHTAVADINLLRLNSIKNILQILTTPSSLYCYDTCCNTIQPSPLPSLSYISKSISSEQNLQHQTSRYRNTRTAITSSTGKPNINTSNLLGLKSTSANPSSSFPIKSSCSCCNQSQQQQRLRSTSFNHQRFQMHHSKHSLHVQGHRHLDHRQDSTDLFNALNLPTPTVLNVLVKPLVKTLFDWTRIPTLLKFINTMKQRVRNVFRWCPTSQQELDEAENKILSHLKCNYKTYYVDIGSHWDLNHVRIWTMEIEPDPINLSNVDNQVLNIKHQQESKIDLLYHEKPQVVKDQLALGLPLVMIHGFASGIGFWALNLDELARRGNRKIFAFDLLGFAKSSRPRFPSHRYPKELSEIQRVKSEAVKVEEYFVKSIEEWRQVIGEPLQNKFILMGHSFGAYIAMAYALRHPNHVAHVLLVDGWGISPENQSRHIATSDHINTRQLPWWAKILGRLFLNIFNPLSVLRALGPWGPTVLHTTRMDIKHKFERLTDANAQPWKQFSTENAENPPPLESGDDLSDVDTLNNPQKKISTLKQNNDKCDFITYIYHCNAQSPPTGEMAFKKLCTSTGWARLPILERIQNLNPSITLTFIYGSRSWIDRQTGLQAKYILATKQANAKSPTINRMQVGNNSSGDDTDDDYDDDNQLMERVEVHVIQGAGHHVYADKPEEFNDLILFVCEQVDFSYFGVENQQDDFVRGSPKIRRQRLQQLNIYDSQMESSSTLQSKPSVSEEYLLSPSSANLPISQCKSTSDQQQKSIRSISPNRPGRKYGNHFTPPKFHQLASTSYDKKNDKDEKKQ